jgi:lipopolysaccharide export system protein LptC
MGAAMSPPLLGPAAAAAARPAVPWFARAYIALSAYLPVLLMAVLALGTWWLVKNTPQPDGNTPAVALRHVPDYTMSRFTVQRFGPDGHLRVRIEGEALRHYPDTDVIEVDNARLHAYAPDGGETVATARTAVSNGDGSEVQLFGGAHVVRNQPGEAPIDFRGEFLHAFLNIEKVRSNQPVVITQAGAEMHADSLDYDNLDRLVLLNGRVRATLLPSTPSNSRSASPATPTAAP